GPQNPSRGGVFEIGMEAQASPGLGNISVEDAGAPGRDRALSFGGSLRRIGCGTVQLGGDLAGGAAFDPVATGVAGEVLESQDDDGAVTGRCPGAGGGQEGD